ncbi:TetR/AcrR family transcriptional regulator [Amycolatopsis nigrescens]|uniref:TetR/AcrR family transcriptional regulator n=1 Tax=Amycolatopsis nigrescens TaxID=381445 RepID=UPI001FDFFC52|nr:TetR/AcrR family transcriptional regulator [Amycolatopsis nigrescens]
MLPDSEDAPRRYESPVRQARARRTRAHVVTTAGRLFAERGYAGTSMRQIAAAAEVSLETVTQTGRKADLLLAAFRDSFAGSPDATDLSALMGQAVPEDPSAKFAEFVPAAIARLAVGVRRSLGIWRAFTVAAAADPAVAAVRAELAVARRQDITALLAAFETVGQLPERKPESRDRLADAVGLIASHEAYDHLTNVCGWPHDEYVDWAAASILAQLGVG